MVNGFTHFMNERYVHFKKMVPLSITFLFYLIGWGLIVPVFSILINNITGSLFLSGIIFSMFGFTRIFFDLSFGLLCDRVSPKKLLQLSLLGYVLVFLLYTIANSFLDLLLLRVFHGILAALLWISGWVLVRAKSKGKNTQEELSVWVSLQNIAYLAGPLIGGLLITFYSWNIAFYLGSVFSLIGFFYASKKVEDLRLKKRKPLSIRKQWSSFFKNKSSTTRLILLTLVNIIVTSAFGSFLPILLDNNSISIGEISVIFSITTLPFILFPVIIGVLSDKYGRKMPTLIGLLLCAYGLFSFTSLSSFIQFLFYSLVIYSGSIFVSMSVDAELNDLLPKSQVGGFTGLFETIKDVGYAIGPLIAGLLASGENITYAFTIMAVISLASTLILKGFKDF